MNTQPQKQNARVILIAALVLTLSALSLFRTLTKPVPPATASVPTPDSLTVPSSTSTPPLPTTSPATTPVSVSPPTSVPEIPRSPLADELGATGTPPEREPAIVLNVCEAYSQQNHGFPSGEDNRAITRALTGKNSVGLPFLPPDHTRINPTGELVDAWDTPFFFHLLSRTQLDIRSAGPDRKLYTEDDIVVSSRE